MPHDFQGEMTFDSTCHPTRHRPMTRDTAMSVLRNLVGEIHGWNQRVRQRQALAKLDDRLLEDVGISRPAAAIEANKPFWT